MISPLISVLNRVRSVVFNHPPLPLSARVRGQGHPSSRFAPLRAGALRVANRLPKRRNTHYATLPLASTSKGGKDLINAKCAIAAEIRGRGELRQPGEACDRRARSLASRIRRHDAIVASSSDLYSPRQGGNGRRKASIWWDLAMACPTGVQYVDANPIGSPPVCPRSPRCQARVDARRAMGDSRRSMAPASALDPRPPCDTRRRLASASRPRPPHTSTTPHHAVADRIAEAFARASLRWLGNRQASLLLLLGERARGRGSRLAAQCRSRPFRTTGAGCRVGGRTGTLAIIDIPWLFRGLPLGNLVGSLLKIRAARFENSGGGASPKKFGPGKVAA